MSIVLRCGTMVLVHANIFQEKASYEVFTCAFPSRSRTMFSIIIKRQTLSPSISHSQCFLFIVFYIGPKFYLASIIIIKPILGKSAPLLYFCWIALRSKEEENARLKPLVTNEDQTFKRRKQ
mmetsp:Transcript_5384/g.10300  ORF Transcript_5384/g.10300 Transcript_5384/m.10300 type:complete len:122 (+) Transcript_5384:143-508(+)